MAPRRPRKNDEAVESLIRNPSSKTDFRPIGNQQVITNILGTIITLNGSVVYCVG